MQLFLKEVGFDLAGEKMREALRLFEVFKPRSNMSENVSYHLKNEMKVKYIKEIISEDE